MIYGVDISNLQGPPSVYRNQQWYRDAEFVIVQTIQPPYPYKGWDHVDQVTGYRGYTGEQLVTARQDGKKIGVYAWLWNTVANPYSDILARFETVPRGLPLDMRPWIDVEDTTNTSVQRRQNATVAARSAGDTFADENHLPPCGGYSGQWYVDSYLGRWWPAGWLKWWADYRFQAGTLLQSGVVVAHQYTSSPVDSDVLLPTEILQGEPEDMAIRVGEGMREQMDSSQDTPLCGHQWLMETDDDGNQYAVERCYGTKGLYISSNSSGSWVNAGPI